MKDIVREFSNVVAHSKQYNPKQAVEKLTKRLSEIEENESLRKSIAEEFKRIEGKSFDTSLPEVSASAPTPAPVVAQPQPQKTPVKAAEPPVAEKVEAPV